ncbi:homeobox protein cut-like 1 [Lontra canadensis]|uniref:homeobox protein cut-like 1 n=1 Tax=Lontra canadensis TaxID=76717 RepID=UPI0013F38DAC|nr:homeobox protein cut-like 1 [Lontra canadensis]
MGPGLAGAELLQELPAPGPAARRPRGRRARRGRRGASPRSPAGRGRAPEPGLGLAWPPARRRAARREEEEMPGRRRPLLAGTAGPRGPKGALLPGRPSSVWALAGSQQWAPAPLRWAGLSWSDRGRRVLHGNELRAPRGSGSGELGCLAGWGSERRAPTLRRGCGLPGDMCLCFFLSQLLGTERLLASGGRRVLPGR